MTDRPILFSGPMIRALLEGRKTQTRRIAKITAIMGNKVAIDHPDERLIELEEGEFRRGICNYESTGSLSGPYPLPYAVGDRLWVREAWTARMEHGWTIADARSRMYQEEILYKADGKDSIDGWWPSIHMPREFSRLTLIVTDVRVQRLQEISEEEAFAEGAVRWGLDSPNGSVHQTARENFATLWDSLNAKRGFGWDANPWVCAVTFTVHQQNIDQMEVA